MPRVTWSGEKKRNCSSAVPAGPMDCWAIGTSSLGGGLTTLICAGVSAWPSGPTTCMRAPSVTPPPPLAHMCSPDGQVTRHIAHLLRTLLHPFPRNDASRTRRARVWSVDHGNGFLTPDQAGTSITRQSDLLILHSTLTP